MKMPWPITLFFDNGEYEGRVKVFFSGRFEIFQAKGKTPQEAIGKLKGLLYRIKCDVCGDCGYMYDHIKLKSVKCECQK